MVTELSGVQFGLKHHFITSIGNCPNTVLGQFKYFIDAVLSLSEIKFIHFWGEKVRVLETKVAKFGMILFHFPAI